MSKEERLKRVLESMKASGKLDLHDLKDVSEEERDIIKTLFHDGLVEEALDFMSELDTDKELKELKEKLEDEEVERNVVPLWKSIVKYAAIFIGIFALTYFFQTGKTLESQSEISDGSIILIMEKNGVKMIDQTDSRSILSNSGEVIAEQQGNTLRYRSDSDMDELVYNELEVPNGKMFDVELSDGTLVHLNSGTTLKYPVKFIHGQKREVFIEGEAYFKVAKDKDHPFVVNADDVAVQVLGTEFNLSSYKDDAEITTVLVEGSVSMTNTLQPQDNLVLTPGTMGSWNKKERSTKMEEVDTELYIGWIKGELIFRNSTFQNMAKILERKYNVTIENTNTALDEKVLTATFNAKIESIEDVLKAIGEIHPLDYEITNQNIRILTKTESQ
ncbi:FecR domain-containing protein [Muricauda sp. CAU 1633]|uniref:FecR family protein n=1 Tax=Allomuricauda sp. CAU 1633 TaxID=2816036 RepID=UPI001A8DA9F7|nr:FecR domain-containing protein [Muricauda sp. CAU 1633]MBO0323027.1 FecR domain-containing protein [Muricauda sp. CAU 1633]